MRESRLVLRPVRLHWIKDQGDEPSDLCAHSAVEFSVGGTSMVKPEEGDWTVSAAGLFLLRTLAADHTPENGICAQLFPCCGLDYYLAGTSPETVIIPHCPSGVNCWVRHVGESVELQSESGATARVSAVAWRGAVLSFCDQVRAFYDRSMPKVPHDARATLEYGAFVTEWDRLALLTTERPLQPAQTGS